MSPYKIRMYDVLQRNMQHKDETGINFEKERKS